MPRELADIRYMIRRLQDARAAGLLTDLDRERYVELCAAESALLADRRSRGLPMPVS